MKTWQAILSTMRYRPWIYLGNVLAMVVFFFALQLPALAMREFFNLLTGEAPARLNFAGVLVVLVASGLGRALGHYMMVSTHVPFMYSVAALLQKNIFAHILQRPAAAALPDSPGEAISRFRDDVDTMRGFPMGVSDLIGVLLSLALALALMIRIDAQITLFAFLPITAVYLIAQVASRRIEAYRKASREATGQVTSFIGEIFGAVQAIKVANTEASVIAHFSALNGARSRTALRDSFFNSALRSMYGNAGNLGTGVILLMAGHAIRAGTFTLGDLTLFMYLLGFVTELPATLGGTLAGYRQAGVSVARLTGLMPGTLPEELVRHGPIYEKGDWPALPYRAKAEADYLRELAVAGLSYKYPGSDKGIEDVDLRLVAGSFTVITGRVGSGKSTLLKVLLGLLPSDRGEIRWNGALVTDPASCFAPPRSAFTGQSPCLFSEALRDNLLMGLPEARIDLSAAVHAAVMERDVEELEQGMETLIGPRGVKLSGGQQQRAAAARMFVREPELLVFDDLSSALDVETEQLLWQRLFARRRATCLVVSHRRPALRRADRIILLREGRVEAEGTLEELLRSCAEMQRLWQETAT